MLGPLNPPIRDWHGRRVWIIGASSGIGLALAIQLLDRGATVAVSARRAEPLEALVRSHPGARALPLDATDRTALADATSTLLAQWERLDLVVWMVGIYQPMLATSFDACSAREHVAANLVAPIDALGVLLPVLIAQGHGALALTGSVAGYRGLPQALAYGPTKAALINLAETLFLDLQPMGIGVHLINPGFVDTRLTARNDFTMPAVITPEAAAAAIVAGFAAGRFEMHFPRRFTGWLKLGRILPYRLYFALTSRLTRPTAKGSGTSGGSPPSA
ncbi:MAG: SDR family NAD(P)-dependent oxidoreductase [Lautropia sp.]